MGVRFHKRIWAVLLPAALGLVVQTTSPAATAAQTPVVKTPMPASKYLFVDDFTGPANSVPSASKWVDYSACGVNGPPAAFGYIRCGADERLNGRGQLVVPATAKWGSGLTTNTKFGFQYGVASAWIKFPATAGYWPAFWMMNANQTGPNRPNHGEVDVMEGYTKWQDSYHAGFHVWSGADKGQLWGGGPDLCPTPPGTDLSKAFHKYSVKVEPNKLTYYFDNKQCGKPLTPKVGSPWPMGPTTNLKSYLILDLAVGGADGQQPVPSRNDAMLVDRVEVQRLS